MNTLRLLKLRFSLIATKDFVPIGYIGGKIRGALGSSMFTLYCDKQKPDCNACHHNRECVYGDLFKNPGKSAAFPTFPAPFVIEAPYDAKFPMIKKGEPFQFSISIFGKAVSWWRQVILSVKSMFENSFEIFNTSFDYKNTFSVLEQKLIHDGENFLEDPCAAVWRDESVSTPLDEISIGIQFLSPVLLKDSKVFDPNFSEFVDAVFYRIASMIDIYEGDAFTVPYGLLYRKPYIQVRQEGSFNSVVFQGNFSCYLPYIDIGSHLHIGKRSTYGFGKYEYKLL